MAASPAVLLLLLLHSVAALRLFVPNTHKAFLGGNVQIPCSFTVDKPPVDRTLLVITWYFQGKPVLRVDDKSETSTNPRLSYVDRAWEGGADLFISNLVLSDGGLYKCSVIYGSQRKEGEVRLDIQAPPQVTITGKTVVLNETSVLRCSAAGFYPVDIGIKWFRGSEMLRDVATEEPWKNQDGVYNVNSSVTIIPTDKDRKLNFSCTVQHESLQKPLQETFQLLYGAIPTVHILPHTFKKNVEQPLVCHISGFYPESIVVNWFLNGTSVDKTETRRINSSALEAVFQFKPTEKNWGTEVSCVVEHETLLRPEVKSLIILGKDLTAHYKPLVVAVAILLSAGLGAGTIFFYVYRYRQKRHPKLRNITQVRDGSFTLNVDHFYPKEISVTWEIFQPPSSKTPQTLESTNVMQENPDGTFNVTSTTESLRDKVNAGEEYTLRATVTHRKLKHLSYKEWTSHQNEDLTYFMSSPELGEILTPNLMLNSQTQLQCTISRFYPDNLTVNWIKKVKGKEEIIKTSEKYKITPHRSQQQRDKTFTCTACLLLTPSLEEQGAEIICRVTHPSLEQPAERSSGQIQVWAKPTLDHPIQLSISDSGDVIAALSLLKFYPKDIRITWSDGQSQEKRPSEERATENPDGIFSITTSCTIPGQSFNDLDFKMKVTWKHKTMDQAESREMSVRDPDFPWRPRIVEMTPLILQTGKQTTVTCKISNFFPKNLTVAWYKKVGESVTECMDGKYNMSIKPERSADNLCSSSASLLFTAESEPDDLEFICKVSHPSLKDPIERSTQKAMKRVTPQMVKPVKLTLGGSDIVTCSMSLLKFYPSSINITWNNTADNKPIPSTRKLIQTDEEQTFDATSKCTVPWNDFCSGVRVTWEHESLTPPQHHDLRVTDLPWRPVIEEIEKPVFHVNTEARLQYKISQYFPNDLTVTWYMKSTNCGFGKLTENTTSTAERQPDNTYSCTASVVVRPSIQDHDGAEIICRVQHPSSKQHMEKSTGPIQVYASPRMQEPIRWSLGRRGEGLCTLSLQGFYPRPIDIKWSCSSHSNVTSRETYEYNPYSTYNVRSECIVPEEVITDHDFKIIVTWSHESLNGPEWREMYIRDAGLPWRPEVGEISTPTITVNKEVNVHCDISGYFPNKLSVTWFVKERGRDDYVPVEKYKDRIEPKTAQYSDTGYRCKASLHVHSFPIHYHGIQFMCEVQHPSLDRPIERSTGPLLILSTPPMVEPVKLTPGGSDTVTCSMSLLKFYPSSINITWNNMAENKPIPSTRKLIQTDEEQTFDATSECTVPWNDFRSGVQVTWEHESLTSSQHHDLRVTDLPWRPVIEEIEKPVFHVNTEARLQCKISQYFPNDLTVTWYIKKTNWGYEKLTENTTPTAERQPDNTYSCTASLVVRPSIQDHDGAEIICRVQHPSSEQHMEKSTGPIQVYASPRMQEPIRWSLGRRGEGLCTLSLQGFYPRPIDIKWSCSSHSNVTSRETYEPNPDSTYNVRSECTVPEEVITDHDFKITVTWSHESLDGSERREMYIRDAGLPWRPEVGEISTPIILVNKEVNVDCDISGYFLNKLSVTWFVKERGRDDYVPVEKYKDRIEPKTAQYSDTGYRCKASLHVHSFPIHYHGIQFMCEVQHPSLDRPIERSTGPLLISWTPQMVKPVKLTPGGSDTVTCSMSLLKFYPSSINITWNNTADNKPIPSTRKRIQMDGEETFDATSECKVPWNDFRSGVRVTWEHESLTSSQHHDLRVTDLPWRPVVEEIEKPVFHVNTEATLQCKISQYFPNDLTVTWYMKSTNSRYKNLTENTTPTAERQPDNTYSCTASLVVRPSIQDHDGAEIICRVQHPSSEQHMEKSTGPIQVYASPRMQEPIRWSLGRRGEGLCTLSLQGFYPRPIDIKWSCSSHSNVTSRETYEANPDSTYNVRSECTVTQENSDDPDFRITVTWSHESLDGPERREMYIMRADDQQSGCEAEKHDTGINGRLDDNDSGV